MSFDLHTHSNISDGTEPPAVVVAAAREAGLMGLALTDHDTTAGWNEAISAAEEHAIALIPGMEVTTQTPDGISVHMLSYLHDPEDAELAAVIAQSRDGREDRARRIVRMLSKDFPLTWSDVEGHVSEGATVGRPHLADALVGIGVVRDRQEAFDTLLYKGSPYYVSQENVTPVDAIGLITRAGGVPVIAHAMAASRGRTVNMTQLEEMIDAGLAGVEVRHRDNPESGQQLLLDLASRHDLLVTGSSDYHGTGKTNRLGENTTDLDSVYRIVELGHGSSVAGPLPLR